MEVSSESERRILIHRTNNAPDVLRDVEDKNHMTSRYRNIHILLSILFFTLCVLIVQYSHELRVWRGYIGDVVVIMFLYSLVQSIHQYPSKMVVL